MPGRMLIQSTRHLQAPPIDLPTRGVRLGKRARQAHLHIPSISELYRLNLSLCSHLPLERIGLPTMPNHFDLRVPER